MNQSTTTITTTDTTNCIDNCNPTNNIVVDEDSSVIVKKRKMNDEEWESNNNNEEEEEVVVKGDDDDDDDDGWGDDDGNDEEWNDDDGNDEEWDDVDESVGFTGQNEWEKWLSITRALTERAKVLREKQNMMNDDGNEVVERLFNTDESEKILLNQLINIMREPLMKGVEVSPIDDSIYHWSVRISTAAFEKKSPIFRALSRMSASVLLELAFPVDMYPYYPPTVMLMSPRLSTDLLMKIVCMDEVKLANWNPTFSAADIIRNVHTCLCESEKPVDSPDEVGIYSRMESLLTRLNVLRGEEELVGSNQSHSSAKGVSSSTPWAKGTGYGSSGSSYEWNVDAWTAAIRKKKTNVNRVLVEIAEELSSDGYVISDVVLNTMIASDFVLQLRTYLVNDSMVDMSRSETFYVSIYETCIVLLKEPRCREMVEPLVSIIRNRTSQAETMLRLSMRASKHLANSSGSGVVSSSDETPSNLSACLMKLREAFDVWVATDVNNGDDRDDDDGDGDQLQAAAKPTIEGDEESVDMKALYVSQMEDLRFGEVDSFVYHTFLMQSKSLRPPRGYMMRLTGEFGDLSTSLPISYDSSCFIRVSEESLSVLKLLIIAPDNTPYGRGCFLFDVFFPQEYPAVPPRVILLTTGNGQVRFNPNLYANGKVCLSLLGTWRGNVGETWLADVSTFLQVVISIQSFIFVPEPYFNEPSYEHSMGTPSGTTKSQQYNANLHANTIRWAMIEMLRSPPQGFEDVIRKHFAIQRNDILDLCNSWAPLSTSHGQRATLLRYIDELEQELNKLPPITE